MSASSAAASLRWNSRPRGRSRFAAGVASSTGFELLEKLGFHDWDFDYVLLDFLGDVVCGGFGLPIARDMAQKVILVGSNDLQSLYVANNVCSAVEYFRKLGATSVSGLVINKDDGSGEAQAFAKAVNIPVLAAIRQTMTCARNRPTTRSSARWNPNGAPCSRASPMPWASHPPCGPNRSIRMASLASSTPRTRVATINSSPATDTDMRGKYAVQKPSLEVIYDDA